MDYSAVANLVTSTGEGFNAILPPQEEESEATHSTNVDTSVNKIGKGIRNLPEETDQQHMQTHSSDIDEDPGTSEHVGNTDRRSQTPSRPSLTVFLRDTGVQAQSIVSNMSPTFQVLDDSKFADERDQSRAPSQRSEIDDEPKYCISAVLIERPQTGPGVL